MAIRTKFTVSVIDIDISGYKRELKERMTEELKEAAKDWIMTALSIIPVWSRASHSTFKPLADAVGYAVPAGPLVARKDRSDLGESTSSGRLEFEDDKFFFVYETNLRYLAFNEFNSASKGENNVFAGLSTSTPFNFTKIAGDQFLQRMTELPSLIPFIRGKRI